MILATKYKQDCTLCHMVFSLTFLVCFCYLICSLIIDVIYFQCCSQPWFRWTSPGWWWTAADGFRWWIHSQMGLPTPPLSNPHNGDPIRPVIAHLPDRAALARLARVRDWTRRDRTGHSASQGPGPSQPPAHRVQEVREGHHVQEVRASQPGRHSR